MKKTKIALLALAAALVGSFALTAAACGDDGKSNNKTPNPPPPAASGTEDDPIDLDVTKDVTVTVPEGGTVYYQYYSLSDKSFDVSSNSTNIKLKTYNAAYPDFYLEYESTAGGFSCELYADGMYQYILEFSTKDGNADTYTVKFEEMEQAPDPDGSADYPFEYWGNYEEYGETTELDPVTGGGVPVYYTYTVPEGAEKLYFYVGDNTTLSLQYEAASGTVFKNLDELEDGLEVAEGTEITILASTVEDVGEFWFAIYTAPLGSEDNPIMLEEGTNLVTVPAGGKVYYGYGSFAPVTAHLTSESTNVKVKCYNVQTPEQALEVESDADGFSLTVEAEAWSNYILEFSTKDGAADSYEIEIELEYPEAEEGSEENPFVIEDLGTFSKPNSTGWEDVFFTYTVKAGETLYFSWDDDSAITVRYTLPGEDETWVSSRDEDDAAALTAGLPDLPEGTVIIIALSSAEFMPGEMSFTISNAPIAD